MYTCKLVCCAACMHAKVGVLKPGNRPKGVQGCICVPLHLYRLPSGSLTMLLGADTAAACCFCAAFLLRLAALPAGHAAEA
jgi:hypothetical protein